jgi:trimeric autotransporter adhesin
MPVWSDLFRCRLTNGRKMSQARWYALRALLMVLAVLCMSRWAGATAAPSVSLSPTSLAFGNQASGTTSTAQSISLKNTGSANLSITAIQLTGNYPNQYIQTNNCGTSLAAGATCTISVQFAPINLGSITAAVTLTDNASNSPQTASLSGTGTSSPSVSLSPTSLAFGNQAGGTISSVQSISLRNTGNGVLSITSISLTGGYPNQYIESNNCGTSLAAGAGCMINVQFAPINVGSITAVVTLGDNAGNSPQSVPLSGTGTNSGGNGGPNQSAGISLSPGSLSFGNQPIDIASSPETITLSNISGALLSLSGLTLTGANSSNFSENNTCGTSLALGGSCKVVILFTPSASGSRSASLSVTNTLTGILDTASLSGTGTHDVILTWKASPGAAGYDIYRGSSSGGESSTALNSSPVTSPTYTDTSVQAGQTYYYKITAVGPNGSPQSGKSSEVSATVPSP